MSALLVPFYLPPYLPGTPPIGKKFHHSLLPSFFTSENVFEKLIELNLLILIEMDLRQAEQMYADLGKARKHLKRVSNPKLS